VSTEGPLLFAEEFCSRSACACELVVTYREKLHATKGYE